MSKNCEAERQKIAQLEAEIRRLRNELGRIHDLCRQAQKNAVRVQNGAPRGEWAYAKGQDELAAKILQASPVIEYRRQGQKRTRETYHSRKDRRQGGKKEKVIGRLNPWGLMLSIALKFVPGGWLADLVKK